MQTVNQETVGRQMYEMAQEMTQTRRVVSYFSPSSPLIHSTVKREADLIAIRSVTLGLVYLHPDGRIQTKGDNPTSAEVESLVSLFEKIVEQHRLQAVPPNEDQLASAMTRLSNLNPQGVPQIGCFQGAASAL